MSDYTNSADDSDERKTEVLKTFHSRFSQSKQHSQDWRAEAKDLLDLKAGHQWSQADEDSLKAKYQGAYPMVTFNLSDKYSDAVNGMQINNRQEIRYFPRRPGAVAIDEYATGVVKWNRDQCEAEDEESDSFADVFWIGMGWVEHFFDDTEEIEGWIAQERRDSLEMYWDPLARKKNLVDRRYQIRIKPMTAEEYSDFFGDEVGDPTAEAIGNEFNTEDASPQVIPIPHDYGDSTGGSSGPRPVYVADYQWYEMETKYSVKALFPGMPEPQDQEFDEKEWKRIKPILTKNAIQFQEQSHQSKCFYRAWISGDGIKGEIKKLKVGFTFEAITGKRDRNTNTWYGMGRAIRDPQMWVNKFFSSILYTLSVNAKGGLMAEEGAFEDQNKAEKSWADPSAITFVADGAISNNRITQKQASPYPQGMDRLMTFALEALPMTSGLNPEVLGLAQRDQANVLEEGRKKSAMAIVAWVFDSMRRYYKRSGKLMLAMVREYMGEGQLVKIVGQQGAQYVKLIKSKLATDYDVVIDESPTSTNMQERVWAILMQMIDLSIKAGMPVPMEVVDYSPLPEDLKQAWKKKLTGDPQEQQAQKQLAQRKANAEVAVDETKATLQTAQAQKADADAQIAQVKAPIEAQLAQVEAVRKAAEAGSIQAGV